MDLPIEEKHKFIFNVSTFFVHFEYIRDRTIFRCHPSYCSNGKWYNWVIVCFEQGEVNALLAKKQKGMWSPNYFPSKILCSFTLPDNVTVYAVVHSMNASNHDNDSILFERWELENSIKTQ